MLLNACYKFNNLLYCRLFCKENKYVKNGDESSLINNKERIDVMRKKYFSKSLTALLLSLMMTVNLMPAAVLASDADEAEVDTAFDSEIELLAEEEETSTDSSGVTEVSNEDELRTAAAIGGTIRLTDSFSVSGEPVEIALDTTVELNGYTITNLIEGNRLFNVIEAVSFAIDGTVAGSAMTIPAENTGSYGFIKIAAPAMVTLDGGEYTGNTDNGALIKTFDGSADASINLYDVNMTTNYWVYSSNEVASLRDFVVVGGNYTTTATERYDGETKWGIVVFDVEKIGIVDKIFFEKVAVRAALGPVIVVKQTDAIFNNCTFDVTGTSNAHNNTAISVSYGGSATINGGSYTSEGYALYVFSSGGTITVNSGEFEGGKAVVRSDVSSSGVPAVVKLNDGTFKGDIQTGGSGQTNDITITGGTFDSEAAQQYMPMGNKLQDNGDGTFTVVEAEALEVGTEEELRAAAAIGGKIRLTADIELSARIDITKSITVIGDGHTITIDTTERVFNADGEGTEIEGNTLEIVLKDVILNSITDNPGKDVRGLSVYGVEIPVKIVLDQAQMTGMKYALNIASKNIGGVDIEIKNDSVVQGWCAFQLWSPATVNVKDSTLIGINNNAYNADGWNDFATVVINQDATESEINITNSTVRSVTKTGNNQKILNIQNILNTGDQAAPVGNTVTFAGCIFETEGTLADGTELKPCYYAEGGNTLIVDGMEIYIPETSEDGAVELPLAPAALVGEVYFGSITEAIAAAKEGELVTILPGNYDETVTIDPTTVAKGVVIQGIMGEYPTLTGGIKFLGGSAAGLDLTIQGLNFDCAKTGKGIELVGWTQTTDLDKVTALTITNNQFMNITGDNIYGIYINNSDNAINNLTVTNNVFDGAKDGTKNSGLYATVCGEVTVTGNVFNNMGFNGMTLIGNNTLKDEAGNYVLGDQKATSVDLSGNEFNEWALWWNFSADQTKEHDGRAMRLSYFPNNSDLSKNIFKYTYNDGVPPEDYIKLTGSENAIIDVSSCDWNGKPVEEVLDKLNFETAKPYYGPEAEVNGEEYRTLKEAIAAANDSETVTLLQNVTVDAHINLDKAIVLDLNKKTLTDTAETFLFSGAVNFTVMNGTINAASGFYWTAGELYLMDVQLTTTGRGIEACGMSVVTVDGISAVTSTGQWSEAIVVRGTEGVEGHPTLHVYGKVYGEQGSFAIAGHGGDASGTEINIYKGAEVGAENWAIFHPQPNGVLNITDAKIIGGLTAIEMRAGTLNVSGEETEIKSLGEEFDSQPSGNGNCVNGAAIAIVQHTTKQPINVNITGGIISGYYAVYEANLQENDEEAIAKIAINLEGGSFDAVNGGTDAVHSETQTGFITGGTYSSDVKAYVADGCVIAKNSNGKYEVEEIIPIYEITNAEELMAFSKSVNQGFDYADKTVNLMSSIDLSEVNWADYVIGSTEKKAFAGTFDGQGNTIFGLNLDGRYKENLGLFGFNNGTIKNLTVTGEVKGMRNVGAIVGYNKGTLDHVDNQANVTQINASGGKGYIGGLVGDNRGTIANSSNSGTVTAQSSGHQGFGGIAGACGTTAGENRAVVSNCVNTGDVSGKDYVGGIVGYGMYSTIENCTNSGNVKTVSPNGNIVGGIIGCATYANRSAEDCTIIRGCHNTGNVSANLTVGGIVGQMNAGTIEKSTNTGKISCLDGAQIAQSCIGGIVGKNTGAKITNVYNTADVEGKIILYPYMDPSEGVGYAGGIVGYNESVNISGSGWQTPLISGSYTTGAVTLVKGNDGNEAYVGGIVGYNRPDCPVNNSYSTAETQIGFDFGTGDDDEVRVPGADAETVLTKTTEAFASGEVAALLQKVDENVWGQIIGTDAAPIFTTEENKAAARVYTVTFKVDDAVYASAYTNVNGFAFLPAEPSKDLNDFLGWVDSEGNAFNVETPIVADTTLFASFKEHAAVKIGDTTYPTFALAFAALADVAQATVTLLENAAVAETVDFGDKAITLDLNEHTFTLEDSDAEGAVPADAIFRSSGALSVQNGTVKNSSSAAVTAIVSAGALEVKSTVFDGAWTTGINNTSGEMIAEGLTFSEDCTYTVAAIINNDKLTLSDSTIGGEKATNEVEIGAVRSTGKATITNVTIDGTFTVGIEGLENSETTVAETTISGVFTDSVNNKGTMTISGSTLGGTGTSIIYNDGTLTVDTTAIGGSSAKSAVYNNGTLNMNNGAAVSGTVHEHAIENAGTLNIAGGSIDNVTYSDAAIASAIYNSAALNITDGTFHDNAKYSIENAEESQGAATVEGGSFSGELKNVEGATITVKGGDFAKSVCAFVAENFIQVEKENEGYTVRPTQEGETNDASHNWSEGVITKHKSCTESGELTYTCSLCGGTKLELIPASHEEEVLPAEAPTCTVAGKEAGKKCSVCGIVTVEQTEIPATGHTEVEDAAVAPTCTTAGKTAGKHCEVCGEITVAQEEIAALEHLEVVDAAVAATCTDTGLTEGLHCERCNVIFIRQEVIPANGHTVVTDAAVAATCTETGLTEGSHCSVCNEVITAQTEIAALGHITVVDAAVAPTCTETGLTVGSHCSRCETVLEAQQVIDATGHTTVTDEAVAATCETTGLTEGSHCSVCDTVFVEQQMIAATGHSYGEWTITTEPTSETTGMAQRICANDEEHIDTVTLAVLTDETVWTAGERVEPTCEEAGSQVYTSAYGSVTVTLTATGHSYSEWTITTEPTNEAQGEAQRVCASDETHVETVTLAVLTDETVWTAGERVEPTCEEAGSQVYTSAYGAVTVELAAMGHNFIYTANNNVITETCQNGCEHSETATLTAAGGTANGNNFTGTVTYSENWAAARDTEIVYTQNGAVVTDTSAAGTYVASLAIGDVTVSVEFTVAPRRSTGGGGGGGGGGGSFSAPSTPVVPPADDQNQGGLTEIEDPNVPLSGAFPFDDVTENDWFYESVGYVYNNGMMNGTADTLFGPQISTTRGMIATILYRLEGEPESGASTFTDVAVGQYYYNAIAWAAENGIVTGYGDGTFGPDDSITREQMAAILYRYAGYKEYDTAARADLTGYIDANGISPYAVEAVQWAVAKGLLTGMTENTLVADGEAVRAQIAMILTRFCENIVVSAA